MLPTHAGTAAIAGERIVLLGGKSHAYLKDHDIEMSNTVWTHVPDVDVFFTGFVLSCWGATPAAQQFRSIEARIEYQELLEMDSVLLAPARSP